MTLPSYTFCGVWVVPTVRGPKEEAGMALFLVNFGASTRSLVTYDDARAPVRIALKKIKERLT